LNTRRGRRSAIGVAVASMLLTGPATLAAPGAQIAPGKHIEIAPAPNKPAVSLHYEEQGSGPPLLLLHGLGESTFTWRDVRPALATRYRVIALDLKGFGKSDKPDDGGYGADDQALLVERFIATLGLEKVSIVGHSFGGTVALRTALAESATSQKRIRRIVVISAPALPRAASRELDLIMKTPFVPDTVALIVPTHAAARFLLKEAMNGREPSEGIVEGYAAPYEDKAAIHAFLATARSIVDERDTKAITKRYRDIKVPVLAVWCRKDPIVPLRSGRRLVAALPRASLSVLDGCHHLPQHERPKQLVQAIRKFLD
jgi:pimeloyl-ACP methyl ester carboxylesterase